MNFLNHKHLFTIIKLFFIHLILYSTLFAEQVSEKIVIIDQSLPDYQVLSESISSNYKIIIIESDKNAIHQLNKIIGFNSNIGELHIFVRIVSSRQNSMDLFTADRCDWHILDVRFTARPKNQVYGWNADQGEQRGSDQATQHDDGHGVQDLEAGSVAEKRQGQEGQCCCCCSHQDRCRPFPGPAPDQLIAKRLAFIALEIPIAANQRQAVAHGNHQNCGKSGDRTKGEKAAAG